jgi:hypothetical protein
MYLTILAMLFVLHGKPYYIAPMYPVVFAGGAVMLERLLEHHRRRWARTVVLVAQLLGGAALAPFSLPLLPLDTTDRLIQAILGPAIRSPADLTLEFHEQYGWPEQAATIAAVFRRLPEADQARAAVLAHNYAQAGAIEFYGPALGLPAVASGHMTYYLWGPPRGDVVIAYGMPEAEVRRLFADVHVEATIAHPLASPWQTDLPVYVCRQPRKPLAEVWPELWLYRHQGLLP